MQERNSNCSRLCRVGKGAVTMHALATRTVQRRAHADRAIERADRVGTAHDGTALIQGPSGAHSASKTRVNALTAHPTVLTAMRVDQYRFGHLPDGTSRESMG